MTCVSVTTLSGECVEKVFDEDTKVSTVKAWLAQECKVPILAQTLICRTVELENSEKIGPHSGGHRNTLCLTMLITLNDAIAQFKESDAYEELKTKWGM